MAKIFPLSEGEFTVGHDKVFIPFDERTQQLTDRATGSIHVEVQPFLVVTDKDVIILDTGLGFRNASGNLMIHDNLFKLGFGPNDITKVLLSHLHKDHAGCLIYTDTSGNIQPTFPKADYYIYSPEAAFAAQKGAPSYIIEDFESILSTDLVKWLDGTEGVIDGYIHYMHSGGHSPQHIVYLIDDGEDKVFYGGDEAPQLKQLKVKYVAKYDYDGKKAMQLREQYAERGMAEKWYFLFYHDVKTPFAQL